MTYIIAFIAFTQLMAAIIFWQASQPETTPEKLKTVLAGIIWPAVIWDMVRT